MKVSHSILWRKVSAFILPALLIFSCGASALAQENNYWTGSGSAAWESTNWSLGVVPGPGQYIWVNNAGSKQVVIGPSTAQNYPQSLQIKSLDVWNLDSATTNEVLMDHVGLDNPLVVGPLSRGDTMDTFTVGSLFVMKSSALVVHGELVTGENSLFVGANSQITVEGFIIAAFSPSSLNVTNCLLLAGAENLGWGLAPGEMNQQGGTNIFTDYLSIDNFSQYVLNSGWLVGTSLSITRGGTLKDFGGTCIISNIFLLDDGTWQEDGGGGKFGHLLLGVGPNSVIRLSSNNCVLQFADSSSMTWSNSGILTIQNWNGSLSGGGTNQLIFGTNTNALTAQQLRQIQFANPPGLVPGKYLAKILTNGEVVPDGTALAIAPAPFFSAEVPLGSTWYYLAPNINNAFGYYSMMSFPFVHHLDLGLEYFVDAGNAAHGGYFYDFSDSVWFYTQPNTFPYLYDFNANAWLFYNPQAGMTDRYTSNPRWFFNFSTQTWTNHL